MRSRSSVILLQIAGLAVVTFAAVWYLNQDRGVPWGVVILIVFLVFWSFIASRTRFGRHVYAVGGNAEAARRAGINVDRVRIAVFMIGSFMAGVGGIMLASRLRSVATNTGGGNLLLLVIASAVIGGTSLFGGVGRVVCALLGRSSSPRSRTGWTSSAWRRGRSSSSPAWCSWPPCSSTRTRSVAVPPAAACEVTLRAVRAERLGKSEHPKESQVKTSLGIWALGPMVTRFVPAGYQPQWAGETTADRVRRAVEGLGDLMDDYEFHYPGELSPENLDDVREALGGHGIYCIASGLHLDPRFGRGGLTSPDAGDPRPRPGGWRSRAADLAGSLGAHFIVWPGIEGYNYPFQTPYAESWKWFVDGIGEAAQRCADHGVSLFLEHKNSEPAMKIFMRNIGMTLHVIHKLREQGITNVKVNMDWQHLIMNGESLGEYAAMLAAEGLLGPPARQLGLGDVRRRQHGRRHGVHGDARARRSSSAAPATARTASGSASTSTRTRRTPSPRCGAACSSGGSSTRWQGASTTPRCARRRRRRTPSAPTSWCTRRWAAGEARPGARDRRGGGARGARARSRSSWPTPTARSSPPRPWTARRPTRA